MFKSFTIRILVSVLATALLAIGFTVFYGMRAMERGQELDVKDRMTGEAQLAGELFSLSNKSGEQVAAWFADKGRKEMRITVIGSDGGVLFDSARPNGQGVLDNHADRPEIVQAVKEGTGFSMRDSGTVETTLVYAAARMDDGSIIRLAVPLDEVRHVMWSRSEVLLQAGILVAILSVIMAVLVSLSLKKSFQPMIRVVEYIASGHLERRICKLPGREFAPLADAVNTMAQSIEEEMRIQADQTTQLETILNTMSDGVLVLGQKGNIRRCNRALERSFPSICDARGRQVVELIPSPALQNAVQELLSQENFASAKQSLSLHMGMQDGRVFSVLLSRPQRIEPRVGLVIVFHDITEMMRLERVRRDFVANVSHELRTPLTAITGYAETMLAVDDAAQCREFASVILRKAQGLEHMTRDLLGLTRLESTDTNVEVCAVSVLDACDEAAALCDAAFAARHMSVSAKIEGSLSVLADFSLLVQVFRNLLENAARYGAENSVVQVTARESDGQVLCRVHNEGPLIPHQDLERIFERFYSVERHRGQGTGLGLAICRHILERLHGSIWAESPDAEQGTSFVFVLPAAAEDKEEQTEQPA